jgi:transcriptional regulator with XRE-family HTH domain
MQQWYVKRQPLSREDVFMEFGQWIRSVRKQQKLDIRTLAVRTGVEASTISRVENTRTQVTLGTAIRICEGLGMTATDLLLAVRGKRLVPLEEMNTPTEDPIPTLHTIEMFLNSFRANPEAGYLLLSNLLNKVVFLKEEDSYPFLPEGVRSLLFHSPIYQFEIQYPPDIEAEDILTIYKRGGVLTLVDIGTYVKKIRREKQVTLAYLEDTAKVSSSVLSRLETGLMEQVKLADILRLDDQLEQDGKLLAMYWRVHHLNMLLLRQSLASADRTEFLSLPKSELEGKLLSVFITLHRWLQHVPDASYGAV